MIKTICYFINWPLDDYHARIYGVKYFDSLGLEVVVCNMTRLLTPHVHCQPSLAGFSGASDVQISSWQDLESFLQGKGDIFGIVVLTLQKTTAPFYRILKRFNVPYLNFYSNNIPTPSLRCHLQGRQAWRRHSCQSILKGLLGRMWRRSFGLFSGLQPPRYLLKFGKSFALNCPLPNAQTQIIDSHTLDFDLTLGQPRSRQSSQNKFVVFLDEFLFGHPDFLMQGGVFPIQSDSLYFTNLRKLFDLIETTMRYRVVIAAHPRATDLSKELRFGKREIIQWQTGSLVSQSEFVITHCSTSVSFAVLYRKPIIFLTSNEIDQRRMGSLVHSFARAFGQKPLNIDSFNGSSLSISSVSEPLYKDYEENYVKFPSSPIRPLWSIVKDRMVQDGLISSDT